MGKAQKPMKVLILCRREDMMNYSCKWATELGFEAHGACTNEAGKELIQKKGPFVMCAFGCQFWNQADSANQKDLQEMKEACDAAGLPYKKMPTFGDVRTILVEHGVLREAGPHKWEVIHPAPMIAG